MAYSYSTNIKYAVRFRSTSVQRGILHFTQFSQNCLLTMKYCSVKDCNSTSSCENEILQSAHDKRAEDCNSQMENKFSQPDMQSAFLDKNAIEVPKVKSNGTMLNYDNFLHCFFSIFRKSLSKEITIYQECNARKVNCGRVYSAYILKPVLSGRNL